MSSQKLCKFYNHSKCLLTNNFCELDCSRFTDETGFGVTDTRSSLMDWRNEEMDKEIRKAGWKLG